MEQISLLYPPEYQFKEQDQFTNFQFIDLLGLKSMIRLKNQGYLGLSKQCLEQFFTKNEQVLAYRVEVVKDMVEISGLQDLMKRIVPMIQNISDMRKVQGHGDDTIESNLYSIRTLEMYTEILDLLGQEMADMKVQSEGMRRLKQLVIKRYESQEYSNMKKEMSNVHTSIRQIKSITVGINIDGTLRAQDAGIVSINTKEYKKGSILNRILHQKGEDKFICMTDLVPTNRVLENQEQLALNTSLTYGLNTIFAKSIKSWEPIIRRYFSHCTDFLIDILDDIRFLTAGVEFILEMKQYGLSMCKPEIKKKQEKCCTLHGVYNPMVAIALEDTKVVANDFQFDEQGMFYIITGPNHGGKSVFAYSIGMAQALFQLGLYIPAESGVMSPVDNIFTHFPSSDENNYGKGRLESECERLRIILDEITEDSMIILDEAFSSTSGTEAGYIASEVITSIGVIGCRGLFVTHIHDLPLKVKEFNQHPNNRGKIDNLAALMENKEDGTRSYRLARIMPDGLSYAKDIAKKYGLVLEDIVKDKSETSISD